MSRDDAALAVAMDAELAGRADDAARLRVQAGFVPESPLEELIGKTLVSIVRDGNESITFEATTGDRWKMHHAQDCCESVSIDDVVGDLDDLVGAPIAMAEESTNRGKARGESDDESFTWTFYKFASAKGYVTIRWYGSSNGYYSEYASLVRVTPVTARLSRAIALHLAQVAAYERALAATHDLSAVTLRAAAALYDLDTTADCLSFRRWIDDGCPPVSLATQGLGN